VISELWIGKDREGSGCWLVWETMPGISVGNEENPGNTFWSRFEPGTSKTRNRNASHRSVGGSRTGIRSRGCELTEALIGTTRRKWGNLARNNGTTDTYGWLCGRTGERCGCCTGSNTRLTVNKLTLAFERYIIVRTAVISCWLALCNNYVNLKYRNSSVGTRGRRLNTVIWH